MKFRFIPLQTYSAAMNMAYDEVIMESVKKKESLPTIRFYSWLPSAVSIGYFQGLHQEVNEKECVSQGVDIVRRQTGGGAVYHEHEITYSLIAPENEFPKNIVKSYEDICGIIVNALSHLGLDAVFSPINDILINHQKISGNAQTRKNGILLQHGTILCKVNIDKMFLLLKVSKEKRSDKFITSVKKAVTSLEEQGKTQDEFLQALHNSFSLKYELLDGKYSQKETIHAKELAKKKYSSKEWLALR